MEEGLRAGTDVLGMITDPDKTMKLKAKDDLPIGHKVALKPLKKAGTIIEYGDIGKIITDCGTQHPRTHKIQTEDAGKNKRDRCKSNGRRPVQRQPRLPWLAARNGRVGVRNHVVILPLDDLSNAACEAVANNIKGTLAPAACLRPACSSAPTSTCISAR